MAHHQNGDGRPAGEVIESREAAEHYVGLVCFKIGPPRLVGIELEWIVHDQLDPALLITAPRLAAALGRWAPECLGNPHPVPLPCGSLVTVEPGGQLELSSRPADGLTACAADVAADSATLLAALDVAGLTGTGSGTDAVRPPARVLHTPRYDAMESYFDRRGPDGRTMMCSTAAAQVSLDAGTDSTVATRWRALHTLGPVLVAMFANSPVRAGRATGWQSSRQATWFGTDPARTAPHLGAGWAAGGDPRSQYARFALDAPLLCVRRHGTSWTVPAGITFAGWIAGALGARPTYADLAYHLTTLFPPVRPQGHLEVRYVDAQPGGGWLVPVAVLWALTSDEKALEAAVEAADPVSGQWVAAARRGLGDPAIGRAARRVLAAAQATLGGDPADAVAQFASRYTERGRSPADDWVAGRPPVHVSRAG
jgi:glutamate--cysteine ligase